MSSGLEVPADPDRELNQDAHSRRCFERRGELCKGAHSLTPKLPYLDAVINETLRLDPIVPDVLRTLTVDKELNGHLYPAGTNIAVVSSLLHARDDLYPEPQRFKPER